MGDEHTHGPSTFDAAFAWGIGLNVAYVFAEAFFGIISNSMSLLADAGHNVSDVLGLLVAWWASRLGRRPPTLRRSYAFRGASILAALFNASFLLAAIGAIAWEAIRRFSNPQPVPGKTIMWVAGFGIVINTITALLFISGRKHDLNIRGAFLHMAADAAVSAGVVLAGFLILWTGQEWIDPTASLLVVAVIFYGTWGLLKESLNLALQAVPKGIDPTAVKDFLTKLPNVIGVHDLHIWGMSTTQAALTVHLVIQPAKVDDAFLRRVTQELHEKFQIEHSTIQVESGENPEPCCRLEKQNV